MPEPIHTPTTPSTADTTICPGCHKRVPTHDIKPVTYRTYIPGHGTVEQTQPRCTHCRILNDLKHP